MSLQHKRRTIRARRTQAEPEATGTIPAWKELTRLSEEEARTLAEANGIEWAGRMGTLSALNKARQP